MSDIKAVTGLPDYVWDFLAGWTREGEAYRVHRLIDGSGRVLAKVVEPDDHCYDFRAYFHLEGDLDKMDARFVDADSARRFVIETLAERAAKLAATAGAKAIATETETAKTTA